MPRNLSPSLIAFDHELHKGALVLLPPVKPSGKKPAAPDPSKPVSIEGSQTLRFQYNPETVTRTRTGAWEPRKNNAGAAAKKGDKAGGATTPQERTATAFRGGALFSKSETIAMKLIFDATELLLDPTAAGKSPEEGALGVLPELGVLEQMAIAAPPDDKAKDKTKPAGSTKLTEAPPKELLLVLNKRVFPVIITNMTITEKRFSPELVPLRAEVDLQMQIMEATEVAGHAAAQSAYTKLLEDRLANAQRAAESISSVDAIQSALTQKPPSATR